ncbi:HNH endonuclease [Paenibacillus sp. MBLB4367]|uniref:HNH endonuclease n=1 Tax=Paenibacillus sp. MBLB4367 TaxID=3384767 RepID=UPI003907FFB6
MALKKFCRRQGCQTLTEEKYCEEHRTVQYEYDKHRPTAAQRGYNSKWRKARETYLKRNPLCKQCFEAGKLTSATVVDHIKPHKGDWQLFWDSENNWQSLCKPHHDAKTVKEDGGFGR